MSGAENTKPGAEPSMDDILASIRKILNEDDAPGAPATIPEPPAEPLMLTEEMLVAEPEAPPAPPPAVMAAPIIAPPPPPVPRDPPPAVPPSLQVVTPPPEPRPQVAVAAPPPSQPASELLAPAAAAAAAASMGQLLRAVTQERGSAISRGGPTIEDVVREEIRPLLKEWLDNHLPGIVERAVRTEIERVAGRGG